MKRIRTISSLLAAVLAICSSQAWGQPAGSLDRPDAPNALAVASELDFLLRAWSASAEQLTAAQLAIDRSRDVRVRQFARVLVREHTTANLRMQELAALRGLGIPAAVREAHAAEYPSLETLRGAAFDKRFVPLILRSYRKTLHLYRTEAAAGKDGSLVRFANAEIRELRRRIARAEALLAQLEMRRRNHAPAP